MPLTGLQTPVLLKACASLKTYFYKYLYKLYINITTYYILYDKRTFSPEQVVHAFDSSTQEEEAEGSL